MLYDYKLHLPIMKASLELGRPRSYDAATKKSWNKKTKQTKNHFSKFATLKNAKFIF